MKRFLYLDDVRTPDPQLDTKWDVVRTYDEFVAFVRLNGLDAFELISLDHDLGDTAMDEYFNNVSPNYTLDYNNILEKTGYDCAKWLVAESMRTGIKLPKVIVHSANPIGASNIMGYVNNYLMNCHLPQTCVRAQVPHIIESK